MNAIDRAERVQRLSPAKRALLLNAARENITRAQRAHAITRRGKNGPAILSYAQQGLWFFEQLEPGSSVFNTPVTVRFVGELNLPALQDSLREITRRQEILHTIFVVVDNQPVQAVLPDFNMAFPLVDLESVSDVQHDIAFRLVNQEVNRPFNLSQDPLLRVTTLRLDREQYILPLTLHHLVGDAWSRGILVDELKALYKAFSNGMPSPLSELPIQYADYAEWQRAWLTGEILDQQLGYWRQQLAAAPDRVELPTDHPRPPVQTYHGAKESFNLSRTQLESLKTMSQREGVTPFMTLLAAFKTLLYRYTGQEDILIGTPVANRNRIEVERLIGLFANVLVLRTDLVGNPTFREVLLRVRRVALEAYTHQDLPFEKLMEELQPERTLSHHPLFQIMFVFENAPMEALELPGVVMSRIQTRNDTAPFELLIVLTETGAGLAGTVEYNSDLFEASTIKRLVRHYERVLAAVVQDAEQGLWQVPMLSEAEQYQLLVEWNETERAEGPGHCLHELFEHQVERSSDRVAVVFAEQQLSYGELNRRANQLAHYLRALGVGAEVLVGLCMERSVEMVVGLLGILKAGGAYVPLDPAYPEQRLSFMLKDAQVAVLLTNEKEQQQSLPWASELTTVLRVDLSRDWEEISSESEEQPHREVSSENVAYVIYTSGSTGRPKGVMVTHGNVLRLLDATDAWFHFGSEDVWTMFHSYAFDFSVWELWGALLYGGRLVVVPYWVSRTPEAYYELLQREQVTVLNQTPSAFRQLQPSLEQTPVERLRVVIFGGEALELSSLRSWYERYGERGPQMVNMYGITETTVHVTYRLLEPADVVSGRGSLIGRRIPDLELYLLDEQQGPVPVGVAGELYVGGGGVARGYLNRAELTAERFIPHPFSTDAGERLYRTGDLGRYLADGDIEFLGRADHQVKLRGYRVELGEIEAVLREYKGVQEAVVDVQGQRGESQRLVAYVLTEVGAVMRESGLRSYVRQRLPEYMVPGAVVLLEELPLLPNGKLNRRALPRPGLSRAQSDKPFVPPRTPVEQQLAALWTELLGMEQVSIYDNFFVLGGHSLLLTQLVSRIRNALYVEVPLRRLFEAPTILEMTQVVAQCQAQQHDPADLAQMLQELSVLSSDEIKVMLTSAELAD